MITIHNTHAWSAAMKNGNEKMRDNTFFVVSVDARVRFTGMMRVTGIRKQYFESHRQTKKKEENTNQCDTVHMFYKPNARYSLICVSICAPNQNIVRDWTEVTTLGHGLWFFKKKKNKIIFMCRVCGRYMCISENPSTQEQERTPESENNNVNNVLPTTYDAMHVWAFLTENLVQQHRLSVRTECSKTIHKCRSCHVSHSALI